MGVRERFGTGCKTQQAGIQREGSVGMTNLQTVEVRAGQGNSTKTAATRIFRGDLWTTIRSALTISRMFNPSRTEVTNIDAEPSSSDAFRKSGWMLNGKR